MQAVSSLFYLDSIAIVMTCLISLVTLSIGAFSFRYLRGDRKKRAFYLNLGALIVSVLMMVTSDHLLLLPTFFMISNFFLARLMLHKAEWKAAKGSFLLASKNFALNGLFLISFALILYFATGETSIQLILKQQLSRPLVFSATLCLLLAAMTQSALFPFHRWLLSSLNSPTPVSALMHAGLVNGGGFLLLRFHALFSSEPMLLNLIFIFGIVSALLGICWKLIQSDVKRMLACSTMGQMGFMIAECGLGLFPAALIHLCCHGFFKAFLFLASGSAAKEKRLDLGYPPTLRQFFWALLCALVGASAFGMSQNQLPFQSNTLLFFSLTVAILGAQFALTLVRSQIVLKFPLSLLLTPILGYGYGVALRSIEAFLSPVGAHEYPLGIAHILALILLFVGWLAVLFRGFTKSQKAVPFIQRLYVLVLNQSQPHPSTITSSRNDYRY